ncbi:MAG: class I SAM-dependent methyltransferase [Dehalococcoidales bacterium]|nr:MAG: class I SAM-dependent methyltransferase [Dehalococcoidales bacterium]
MLTVDYDLLAINKGERVLDVGCGEGRHTTQACKETECTVCAMDIDPENVIKTSYMLDLMEQAGESRASWGVFRGDALRLPFKDTHFDKVICSEVLEHVPDDNQAVRELTRVLKDDGTLAISVPTYFSEAIYWKISPDYRRQPGGHVRKYRLREVVSLLQQNGLHVFTTRRKHGLHFFYWLLRCLFGINRQQARIPALYHRFLVWDIMTRTRPIRLLENLLNPIIAKSVVLYAHKNNQGYTDA